MTADPGGPRSFPDWLAHRARTTPARLALAAGGRTWTFAELDAEVVLVAGRLAAGGVRGGDRVATLLPNGAGAAVLVHAVLRAGATLVPLNTRLGARELAWQVGDAGPRLLIVEPRTAEVAAAACEGHEAVTIASYDDLVGATEWSGVRSGGDGTASASAHIVDGGGPPAAEQFALHERHPAEHVLAIIYTSGTTGRPKGAMLTVANFWWSAVGSALNLGTHVDDRWLACLPLFHVGGLSIVVRGAIGGFAVIVHDGFSEFRVSSAIDDEGITIVSMVATTLDRLLAHRGARAMPATLRCILLGGGPAPQPLLERCATLGLPVVQTYGLTEATSQVATLAPEDALRKLGSAGHALYPNELRIAAPAAGALPLDGAGEILVRGPIVMAGYAGRPEDTAHAIRDGWLHTGDIGRLDDDGFLYVLDRRDDLIVTGGENVYPAEVEAVLLGFDVVLEAGVVGIKDAQWGQRVVAFVRLPEDIEHAVAEEALLFFCRAELAPYKVPRVFHVLTVPLPRTASGKLQRATLRDLAEELAS